MSVEIVHHRFNLSLYKAIEEHYIYDNTEFNSVMMDVCEMVYLHYNSADEYAPESEIDVDNKNNILDATKMHLRAFFKEIGIIIRVRLFNSIVIPIFTKEEKTVEVGRGQLYLHAVIVKYKYTDCVEIMFSAYHV